MLNVTLKCLIKYGKLLFMSHYMLKKVCRVDHLTCFLFIEHDDTPADV